MRASHVVSLTLLVICTRWTAVRGYCPVTRPFKGCTCYRQDLVCNYNYTGFDLPDFRGSGKIYDAVDIWGTHVYRVDALTLPHVRTRALLLANNLIQSVHPKAFWRSQYDNRTLLAQLETIHLSRNRITHIRGGTFDPLTGLTVLNLSRNRLSSVAAGLVVHLNRLLFLHLSDNRFTELPADWLPDKLTTLDISDNLIVRLNSSNFERAPELQRLTFSPNLTSIEFWTFTNKSRLMLFHVLPDDMPCNCGFTWFLRTRSLVHVCDIAPLGFRKIRRYLYDVCCWNFYC